MKFYAKKLRIHQVIIDNFAHYGLCAFDYEDDKMAKLGNEKAKMEVLKGIHEQMEIMGYANKLDRNWALKIERGNIEEIEKFIGREIMTKSEGKMLGYMAEIYLLIEKQN